MAWYRCMGGSGLPAGLQTDMDAVLNKKFSTSTTYPPADWPDTVNLMGPLPERTASGSIAHIEDGASEVPVKNWLVTLPASLSGYSEVNGKQAKKNFLNDSIRGHNGANIYFAHDTGSQNDFAVRLRAGTYTFSVVTADGTVTNLYVKNSDTDTNITGFPAYNSLSKTFTLAEDTNCAVYVYKSGYTDVTDILTAQIEYGSTATAYEAYEAPTQYTASLGRTIYGGTADIVNGEGEDENGNAFTFTPITPTPETENVCNFWADEGDSSVDYYGVGTIQPPIQPTLITKNITENGTYTASSDSADGYSEVTVSVQASAFLVNDTNWSTSGLTYSKSVTITTAGNYAIRWSSYSDRPTIKVNNTTLSFTYSNASRYAWYLNETVALGVGDTISFELSASGNNAYIAQVEEVE